MSSEPNGDVRVTVSVGAQTDKDHDGDIDTAIQGDTVSLFFAVVNQSDITQTMTVAYALDGPGTALDRAFTIEVVLEPGGIHQEREELRIQKETALGQYTLTVTGSATETASARAGFEVQPKT